MTSPSLTLGSILLAFSPTFSLLFILILQKPQLLILAVCAAFAYLLAALLSSIVWLITTSIGNAVGGGSSFSEDGDIGTLFALAIPGVICQMFVRCMFVKGYFKVESVIRRSVAKHEEEVMAAAAAAAATNGSSNNTTDNGSNHNNATTTTTNEENNNNDPHAETNALQLQLNDLSCSLASGGGYAILHSLFLYGTLLASESGESNSYNEGAYAGGGGSTGHGGTLYQESCGGIPSLINGALIACLFSVLDVMWMMLCFFGMRRRLQHINTNATTTTATTAIQTLRSAGTVGSVLGGLLCRGLQDTLAGGNAAILLVALTHLAASLVLAPNAYEDGCKISLPLLGGVVLWVGMMLYKVLTRGHFLPEDQRRRIQGMRLGLRLPVDQSHHVE